MNLQKILRLAMKNSFRQL